MNNIPVHDTRAALLGVAALIDGRPDLFEMDVWAIDVLDDDTVGHPVDAHHERYGPDKVPVRQLDIAETAGKDVESCGTVACVAGHAVALASPDLVNAIIETLNARGEWDFYSNANWVRVGAELLGLDLPMAVWLFHCCPADLAGAVLGRLAELDVPRTFEAAVEAEMLPDPDEWGDTPSPYGNDTIACAVVAVEEARQAGWVTP